MGGRGKGKLKFHREIQEEADTRQPGPELLQQRVEKNPGWRSDTPRRIWSISLRCVIKETKLLPLSPIQNLDQHLCCSLALLVQSRLSVYLSERRGMLCPALRLVGDQKRGGSQGQ